MYRHCRKRQYPVRIPGNQLLDPGASPACGGGRGAPGSAIASVLGAGASPNTATHPPHPLRANARTGDINRKRFPASHATHRIAIRRRSADAQGIQRAPQAFQPRGSPTGLEWSARATQRSPTPPSAEGGDAPKNHPIKKHCSGAH